MRELGVQPLQKRGFIPRSHAPIIDGFPAHRGIIREGYPGVLSAQAIKATATTPQLGNLTGKPIHRPESKHAKAPVPPH